MRATLVSQVLFGSEDWFLFRLCFVMCVFSTLLVVTRVADSAEVKAGSRMFGAFLTLSNSETEPREFRRPPTSRIVLDRVASAAESRCSRLVG